MKELLEDIRSGSFRPVYLLYGEEAYLRQDYKNRLLTALLPDGPGMNFSRFQGDHVDLRELMEMGRTQPWFADRRVILLEDTGFFKRSSDELAEYVKDLPDTLVLVFSEEAVDKRNRVYKAVEKAGRAVAFTRLKPDKLVQWAAAFLEKNGRRITAGDAQLLIRQVGVDMGLIRTELDKLVDYTQGRDRVTAEDIRAICSVHLEDRIFEMLRAISSHDQKQALALYYDLLALKEAPVKILVLLGRQYSQLRRAKELKDLRLPAGELASRIGVAPFAVRGVLQCADSYSLGELTTALTDIVETDEAIKTGRISDQLGVELLILRLL